MWGPQHTPWRATAVCSSMQLMDFLEPFFEIWWVDVNLIIGLALWIPKNIRAAGIWGVPQPLDDHGSTLLAIESNLFSYGTSLSYGCYMCNMAQFILLIKSTPDNQSWIPWFICRTSSMVSWMGDLVSKTLVRLEAGCLLHRGAASVFSLNPSFNTSYFQGFSWYSPDIRSCSHGFQFTASCYMSAPGQITHILMTHATAHLTSGGCHFLWEVGAPPHWNTQWASTIMVPKHIFVTWFTVPIVKASTIKPLSQDLGNPSWHRKPAEETWCETTAGCPGEDRIGVTEIVFSGYSY